MNIIKSLLSTGFSGLSGFPVALVAGLIATTVFAIGLTYKTGYDAGKAVTEKLWVQELRERSEAANKDLRTLMAHSNALADKLHEQETTHEKEKAHDLAENSRLRTALRTRTVRLSIPTPVPTCPASAGPQSPGPAPGPDPARTELDPATADALVTITHDGDNAIRDLNACIQRYNTVRQTLNTPAPQE